MHILAGVATCERTGLCIDLVRPFLDWTSWSSTNSCVDEPMRSGAPDAAAPPSSSLSRTRVDCERTKNAMQLTGIIIRDFSMLSQGPATYYISSSTQSEHRRARRACRPRAARGSRGRRVRRLES